MPFKTGTQNKGAPGGDAPSVFSVLNNILVVKSKHDGTEKNIPQKLTESAFGLKCEIENPDYEALEGANVAIDEKIKQGSRHGSKLPIWHT